MRDTEATKDRLAENDHYTDELDIPGGRTEFHIHWKVDT